MKREFKAIIGVVLGFILLSCIKVDKGIDTLKKKESSSVYHIYLLMGQSNMAGRGVLTDEYKDIQHERVHMLNKENKFVVAKHPIHFDKPKIVGVGPGLSFGQEMAKAYPENIIGLVPCAVGGTSITKWEPGVYDVASDTYPYDDAIKRIIHAQKIGVVKGIIWLQGEGDSTPQASEMYLFRLSRLIERLRTTIGNPTLPFVVSELGQYKENYQLINNKLEELHMVVPNTLVVSSRGLVHKGDYTHFDSPSAVECGKRFAKGMLQLQKQ